MIQRSILIACVAIPILAVNTRTSLTNFTLIPEPLEMLETQRYLIEALENIIANNKTLSEEKLKILENELSRNKLEYLNARENTEHYFSNLINRVILIKRLSIDVDLLTKQDVGWTKNASLRYPEYVDLEVTVGALGELQRFYRLNVTQLAEGMLNVSYSLPMRASDCFIIGEVMYKRKLYKEGIVWIMEALRLYQTAEPHNLDFEHIVNAIWRGYEAIGDHKNYIQLTKKLTALKPHYKKQLEDKIKFYNQVLQKSLITREQQYKVQIEKENETNSEDPCLTMKEKISIKKLCRGEFSVNPRVSRILKCWFSSGHHPYSKIAPFKTEQLFINPDLILVHSMFHDDEINTITSYASSQFVTKTEIIQGRPHVYPLLKITAVNDSQVQVTNKLTKRMEDFTGLRLLDTKWVISKYSAGGHYKLHVDTSAYDYYDRRIIKHYNLTCPMRKNEDNWLQQTLRGFKQFCRMTSGLVYLSDVDQGGATVFSVLGLTVYPEKGAALFWDNLLPSGDIDYTLCHGSCPVVHGSKTIAQKWFLYEDQVQTCPLTPIKRNSEDIPPPLLKVKNNSRFSKNTKI